MKEKAIIKMGVPAELVPRVRQRIKQLAREGVFDGRDAKGHVWRLVNKPDELTADAHWSDLAPVFVELKEAHERLHPFTPRETPADIAIWGEGLDANALEQMDRAATLPVAVRGALMPDAHLGYGLPIGGVLAVKNAVIPYAVGVDIACRMRLSVYDLPGERLEGLREKLKNAIESETRFGTGAVFKEPNDHDVLDADWSVSPVTEKFKTKARKQLGTSGSGNHFVEFGTVTLVAPDLGLPAGTYLALLSHSGSRGTGAMVCEHYSRIAMDRHPELPKQLKHLSWLDLDSEAGAEYFAAMNLMGDYAAANHEVIHKRVAKAAGLKIAATVENHHNFAWLEEHDGEEVVVHRKGATPAGGGVLGVIPGSMATPGYVVRGRGKPESLTSASHGAGRVMSRRQAQSKFRWSHVKPQLDEANVELMSAGLDEVPGVYKDIEAVMAAQTDLVDVVARFDPRIVKMAPAGEKAED
ncbi:MAG: RtcB family protein [Planctomycetota bacterium]